MYRYYWYSNYSVLSVFLFLFSFVVLRNNHRVISPFLKFFRRKRTEDYLSFTGHRWRFFKVWLFTVEATWKSLSSSEYNRKSCMRISRENEKLLIKIQHIAICMIWVAFEIRRVIISCPDSYGKETVFVSVCFVQIMYLRIVRSIQVDDKQGRP